MIKIGNTNIISVYKGDTEVISVYKGTNLVYTKAQLLDYVDLGLPSGTMWARGNLIKDSNGNYSIGGSTDYGTYVSWGNIVGYNEGEGYSFTSTTYLSTSGYNASTDIQGNATYDICTARLGSAWTLPSMEQFSELYNNTDNEWTTINGINGCKFMKKTNHSVYVFFPAAGEWVSSGRIGSGTEGRFWSSNSLTATTARHLMIDNSSVNLQYSISRSSGITVRPVITPSTGYTINQTNSEASPSSMIVKSNGASMNADPQFDAIAWIHDNTKIVAAELTLSNGNLVCREVSPTDKTKWKDGTTISNPLNYDFFVKLPEFWWRCTSSTTDIYNIEFSLIEQSGWNHWEGDTFIGAYEAYNSNNMVYSRTGVTPTVSVSQANFKTYARNRGDGYQIVTYEAHLMMCLLGYGWIGTTDVQSVCGKGTGSYPKTTGGCDSLGMTDTVANGNGDSGSTNFWGIENWWGDIYEWIDNIQTTGSYNVALLNRSGSTVRTISTGMTSSNYYGEIKKMVLGTYGDVVPKACASNSSYNKAYADYGRVYSSSGYVASRSGSAASLFSGLGCFSAANSASYAYSYVGSRLLYKGNYTLS